jgi:hypothetical protein
MKFAWALQKSADRPINIAMKKVRVIKGVNFVSLQKLHLFLTLSMKLNHVVFSTIAIAACIACSSDDYKLRDRPYASVDTGEVTDITQNGSTLHGEFLSLGTAQIKDYGFLYDQAQSDPRFNNAEHISLGTTIQNSFSGVADHGLQNGMVWYRAYAVVGDNKLVVYGVIKTFIAVGGMSPSVTELDPASGRPGDVVIINGSAFTDKMYNLTVKFGGVSASISKTSNTSIKCMVPRLPAGNVDVVVSIGVGGTPSSPKTFTVTN